GLGHPRRLHLRHPRDRGTLPPIPPARRSAADGVCRRGLWRMVVRVENRMTDVLSTRERSRTMAAVHSKGNKATEIKVLQILRSHRITGWRRQWGVVGKPDFAFP